MAVTKSVIKNFYGKVIATIETDERGNKTVKDFYGKVLGKYEASGDVTKDFYGRIIARGDATGTLINLNN